MLLLAGLTSAVMWNPISAQEAISKELYLQEAGTSTFLYVGGTVEGYSISGYVPYHPLGQNPCFGTLSKDKKYEWAHLPRFRFE